MQLHANICTCSHTTVSLSFQAVLFTWGWWLERSSGEECRTKWAADSASSFACPRMASLPSCHLLCRDTASSSSAVSLQALGKSEWRSCWGRWGCQAFSLNDLWKVESNGTLQQLKIFFFWLCDDYTTCTAFFLINHCLATRLYTSDTNHEEQRTSHFERDKINMKIEPQQLDKANPDLQVYRYVCTT